MPLPKAPSILLAAVCLLLALRALPAIAQDGEGFRKLGTKIVAEVQQDAIEYTFTANVVALKPQIHVEWAASSPIATTGNRMIGAAALATSHNYCECYQRREWRFSSEQTVIWLSREVLDALLTRGETPFSFNEVRNSLTETILRFLRRDRFELEINGAPASLPAIVAVTGNGTEFWIHDHVDDPLVLAVNGSWSSRVTAILTRATDRIGTWTSVNGRKLHYLDRGTGNPVFVLHGGPGMEFNYFLPYLDDLEANARLIYVDQPGHGLSERFPPNEAYTISGTVAALERLREILGLETITLLGHSYGGMVSQLYALAHPDRVAGLILVDTLATPEWIDDVRQNFQRYGNAEQRNPPRGLSVEEHLRIYFPLYFWPEDRAASNAFLDRAILSEEPRRQLNATREFRNFDMRGDLSRITAPTLVLVGERDLITTPAQARILHEGIAGSHLYVFPETGHNPFVEEPDEFAHVVATFLAELN